jgi:hypothetical protein
VLLSTGSPALAWKIDLDASYFQLAQQNTQLWRQQTYHLFDVNGDIQGGYFSPATALWGIKSIGEVFHRTITSLTVLWIERQLVEMWLPHIECPLTKAWIAARRRAGLTGRDLLPAFVSAFLDDAYIFLAGTANDAKLGRKIVMEAFAYLGWTMSQKKLLTEGALHHIIIVLGHGVDCKLGERFIIQYKQDRIKDRALPAIRTGSVSRDILASLLGLIQSVIGNVIRRWRLCPLYRCLHRDATADVIHLSPRAIACLQRVVDTLHERRSV